jgi:type IV pilus assembly protein PilE
VRRHRGVTILEALTVVVAVVVIAAVAIPLWRTHGLRSHREVAMKVLLAIQAEQDRHFGEHARYAASNQLQTRLTARGYTFEIERGADELSYVATARAVARTGEPPDARCARLSVDQHGRRFATNESGEDSTADCWERK